MGWGRPVPLPPNPHSCPSSVACSLLSLPPPAAPRRPPPPPSPLCAWFRLGGCGCPWRSSHSHGSEEAGPARAPPRPLCLVPSICRGPLLRVRGADRRSEERASCRARPTAPDKLAICCCLSSAFVMQIPEPAAGTRLGGGGVFLLFFFPLFP